VIGNATLAPVAFLFGDSNTEHFLPLFDVFARHLHCAIATQSVGGFSPVSNPDWYAAMATWGAMFDVIILSVRWSMYSCGSLAWIENQLIPRLTVQQTLVLVGEIPAMSSFHHGCQNVGVTKPACFPHVPQSSIPTCNEQLKAFAARFPRVRYFDVNAVLCPRGLCSPWIAFRPQSTASMLGHNFYNDPHHLYFFGAAYAALTVLENWGVPPALKVLRESRPVVLPATGRRRTLAQLRRENYSFV
jgi:hypothetical protein